jgi:hypothetical protein
MRAHFIRGGLETRKDILDRILNRIITIELDAHNVRLNDKGKLVRGIEDDTDYFIDTLEKSGVKWKLLGETSRGSVEFKFSGTKEQLIPVLVMWDAHGRSEEDLTKALKNWDGDENELADIIF